jgi:hypothetical protein
MRSSAIAAARSYEQISRAVETTTSKLADLKSEQESFRASVEATLKGAASIQTFLSDRPGGSAGSFGRFLSKQVARLTKFQTALTTLIKRGLDPALVRDLAAGGLDNQKFAGKLAAASPAQLALINKLQARINMLAKGTADTTAATFDAGIRRVESLLATQIAQQTAQAAQLDRLAVGIVNGIAAAIKGKPLPKFAKGGLTNGPSLAGEGGHRELVLPIHDKRRSDALLAKHYPSRTYTSSFVINQQPGQDPRSLAAEIDRRQAAAVR